MSIALRTATCRPRVETPSPTSTTKMIDPHEHLPESLWLEVMLHLSGKDLVRVFCTHSMFAQLRKWFWGPACEERWVFWSPSTAASADTQRRQQLESPDLWESGLAAVTNSQAIYKVQTVVNSWHRRTLAEWLIEVPRALFCYTCCRTQNPGNIGQNPSQVSFNWHLNSSTVTKAVTCLDYYLSQHVVEDLHL